MPMACSSGTPTAWMPKVTKLFKAIAATSSTKILPWEPAPRRAATAAVASVAGRPNQSSGPTASAMTAAYTSSASRQPIR